MTGIQQRTIPVGSHVAHALALGTASIGICYATTKGRLAADGTFEHAVICRGPHTQMNTESDTEVVQQGLESRMDDDAILNGLDIRGTNSCVLVDLIGC